MILFVGTEEKGFTVDEVAKSINQSVIYTGYTSRITDGVKTQMINQNYTHIVIDCEQLIDDYITIATEMSAVKSVTESNIIFYAVGFSVNSELVQALANKGFRNFVIDGVLSKQKEQLLNAINCVDSVIDNVNEISPTFPSAEEDIIPVVQNEYTTIAFMGSGGRIGTTTHAIQFVKYLQFLGYRACYIEANNSGFVQTLSKFYADVSVEQGLGKVTYRGVDLYHKKENVANVLKLDYDYFIYDFGHFEDGAYNIISFLDKNISVCVCGSKSNELNNTNTLLRKTENSEVFYLFNFCHESEQADISELMDEKADYTVFARYAPDPFTYLAKSNEIYTRILNLKSNKTVEKKKGIWGLFSNE